MMNILKILFLCSTLYWTQIFLPVLASDSSPDVTPLSLDTSSDPSRIQDVEETGGFLKSSILLFAVAFAGIAIARSCLRRASSVIFLTSALVYIASEIALFTGFYQTGRQSLNTYQSSQDEERQIGSLREAARQTDNAAKVALAKSIIQGIVAGGFLTAAIVTIIETALDFPKFTGDCFTHNEREEDRFEYYAMMTPGFRPYHYISSAKDDTEALLRLEELGRFVNGEKSSLDWQTAEIKEQEFSYAPIPNLKPIINLSTRFLVDSFFPQAHASSKGGAAAGMIAALGIGAVAGAIITSTFAGALGTSFMGIMSNGYTRAAIYGVFAGFATWSSIESGIAYNKLNTNTSEYNKLANKLRNAGRRGVGLQAGNITQAPRGVAGNQEQARQELPRSGCFEGEGIGDGARIDNDCSCRETESCTEVNPPDLASGSPDLPGGGSLVDANNSFFESANAVFSGNLDKVRLQGANSRRLFAKLKKHKKDYTKLANKNLKESGKDPIEDWDAYEKETEKYLVDQVSSAFNNLSDKERLALSDLSSGVPTGRDKKATSEDQKETSGKKRLVLKGGKSSGSSPFRFSGTTAKKKKKKKKVRGQKKGKGLTSRSSKEKGEGSQIAGRNKNIFQLVSKRYRESAYQFFFDDEE